MMRKSNLETVRAFGNVILKSIPKSAKDYRALTECYQASDWTFLKERSPKALEQFLNDFDELHRAGWFYFAEKLLSNPGTSLYELDDMVAVLLSANINTNNTKYFAYYQQVRAWISQTADITKEDVEDLLNCYLDCFSSAKFDLAQALRKEV